MQNVERPGKATQSHFKAISKPPQSHILGIDSGVQRHPKASLKPHQGYTKATPMRPSSHPQAWFVSALPGEHLGTAAIQSAETRNPKLEARNKPQAPSRE